jgi:hypothetical protein
MNRVISPSYNAISVETKQLVESVTSACGNRIATNLSDQIIDLSNKTVIDNRNFFDGVIIKVKAGEGFGLALTDKHDLYYLSFGSKSINSFFLCSNVLDFWPFLNVFYLMVQTSNSAVFHFGNRNDFEQAVRIKRNYSEDLLDDGKRDHLQELSFMRMPNGKFKQFSCSSDHLVFLMKQNKETSVQTCGSNSYFKCGHPSLKPLAPYFNVSRYNHILNKIKAITCTTRSTIILTKSLDKVSQLYILGGETNFAVRKVDLVASAYKLFSSDMSDDVVATCKTRGALLFQNSDFKRQDIVLRQKKVESISFMGNIIFGRGHDIVNMFTDLSKERLKRCSDVDIYEYPNNEDPKLKEKLVADVDEWIPQLQVIIKEVDEDKNEDAADVFFDESKFTPPPAQEMDPLDLALREYSLTSYEKRYAEARVIECNGRENKRRKLT